MSSTVAGGWPGFFERAAAVSLQAALLIAFVAVISILARRSSPRFRYALWGVVLLRLCIPVALSSSIGLEARLREKVARILHGEPPPPPVYVPTVRYITLEESSAIDWDALPEPEPKRVSLSEWIIENWQMVAGWAWLSGVLLLGGFIFGRSMVLRRRLRACPRVEAGPLLERFKSLCGQFGPRAGVELRCADSTSKLPMPAVLGIRRPVFLLPRAVAESWKLEDIEPILLHELAHLRRRDPLANLLQIVVQVAYFFHPLVWLANARMRRERELVADDEAIRRLGGDAARYARSLLRVMEARGAEPMAGFLGLAMAERRSSFGKRMRRIMSSDYASRARASRWGFLAVVVIGLAGFAVSARSESKKQIAQAEAAPQEEAPAVAAESVVRPDLETRMFTIREEDGPAIRELIRSLTPNTPPAPWQLERKLFIDRTDLVVRDTPEQVSKVEAALAEKGYLQTADELSIEVFTLQPKDSQSRGTDEFRALEGRIVEAVKALLQHPKTPAGKVWFYEPSSQLTVIDTEENLGRARTYLNALPELQIQPKTKGPKKIKEGKPEDFQRGMLEVLRLLQGAEKRHSRSTEPPARFELLDKPAATADPQPTAGDQAREALLNSPVTIQMEHAASLPEFMRLLKFSTVKEIEFRILQGVEAKVFANFIDRPVKEVLDKLLLPIGLAWEMDDQFLITIKVDLKSRTFDLTSDQIDRLLPLLGNHYFQKFIWSQETPPTKGMELTLDEEHRTFLVVGSNLNIKKVEDFLASLEKPPTPGLETRMYQIRPEDGPKIKGMVNDLVDADLSPAYKLGRKVIADGSDLVVRDTSPNLAKIETMLLDGKFIPDLRKQRLDIGNFSLVPDDPKLKTAEKTSLFARRVYESVETLLYAAQGREAAKEEGRRSWFDEATLQLTIVDTPANMERVAAYLESLPELRHRRLQKVVFLKHAVAEDLATQMAKLLNLNDQTTNEVQEGRGVIKRIRRGDSFSFRDLSIRLMRVDDNDPYDRLDDQAQLSVVLNGVATNMTLVDRETQFIGDYQITAEQVQPSEARGGSPPKKGEGTARLVVRYVSPSDPNAEKAQESGISVNPYASLNALVIRYDNPALFKDAQELIKQLDRVPPQVQIGLRSGEKHGPSITVLDKVQGDFRIEFGLPEGDKVFLVVPTVSDKDSATLTISHLDPSSNSAKGTSAIIEERTERLQIGEELEFMGMQFKLEKINWD